MSELPICVLIDTVVMMAPKLPSKAYLQYKIEYSYSIVLIVFIKSVLVFWDNSVKMFSVFLKNTEHENLFQNTTVLDHEILMKDLQGLAH